jgi:glutamate synthase (ferredoxin)
MVELEPLTDADEIGQVRQLIRRHVSYTGSPRAKKILAEWEDYLPRFVKVMPRDYKRVLLAMERVTAAGLSGEEAIMAAFEENARDAARLGGG